MNASAAQPAGSAFAAALRASRSRWAARSLLAEPTARRPRAAACESRSRSTPRARPPSASARRAGPPRARASRRSAAASPTSCARRCAKAGSPPRDRARAKSAPRRGRARALARAPPRAFLQPACRPPKASHTRGPARALLSACRVPKLSAGKRAAAAPRAAQATRRVTEKAATGRGLARGVIKSGSDARSLALAQRVG